MTDTDDAEWNKIVDAMERLAELVEERDKRETKEAIAELERELWPTQ